MASKEWQKTRWNSNRWHKDGLNTNRDMAYSSTCEMTVFEMQTKGKYEPPPPPPPNLRGSLKRKNVLRNKWTKKYNNKHTPSSTGLDWSNCSLTLSTSQPFPDTAATYCITIFDASTVGTKRRQTVNSKKTFHFKFWKPVNIWLYWQWYKARWTLKEYEYFINYNRCHHHHH